MIMATTEIITLSPTLPIIADCVAPSSDTLCAIGPFMAERILPHQRFRITRGHIDQAPISIDIPEEVPTDIPLPTVVTPQQAVAPEQPPPPNRCRASYTVAEMLGGNYYDQKQYVVWGSIAGSEAARTGLNQIYNNGIKMYGPPADTLCLAKFNSQFGGSNPKVGRVTVWKADKKDGEKEFSAGAVEFSQSGASNVAFFGMPATASENPKFLTKVSADKYIGVNNVRGTDKLQTYKLKWSRRVVITPLERRKKLIEAADYFLPSEPTNPVGVKTLSNEAIILEQTPYYTEVSLEVFAAWTIDLGYYRWPRIVTRAKTITEYSSPIICGTTATEVFDLRYDGPGYGSTGTPLVDSRLRYWSFARPGLSSPISIDLSPTNNGAELVEFCGSDPTETGAGGDLGNRSSPIANCFFKLGGDPRRIAIYWGTGGQAMDEDAGTPRDVGWGPGTCTLTATQCRFTWQDWMTVSSGLSPYANILTWDETIEPATEGKYKADMFTDPVEDS